MIAVTRAVSPLIDRCVVTHIARRPIDAARASDQHRLYERALEELGCTIVHAPPAPALPDAVFVEDAAIVFDETAILTRPALASRQEEPASLAELLSRFRAVQRITAPASLEGGDVLTIGRSVFIGMGERTDDAGAAQLRTLLEPFGYTVHTVRLRGCLHLKTAVTTVGDDTVLINPDWVEPRAFRAYVQIHVDPAEPFAANALRLNGAVLCSDAHPRTHARIERHGIAVRALDISELAAAEAGVTCCSLVFRR